MRMPWIVLPAVLVACAVPNATPPTPRAFPDAWSGTWHGELVWQQVREGERAARRSTGLTLTIGARDADGSWGWVLCYEGQPPRRYRLRAVDAAAGRYAIDEGDGLVLAATWIDDTLVSRFAVGGALLLTRQRFDPDAIRHEIWAGPEARVPTGGGVDVCDVTALQRAELRRVGAPAPLADPLSSAAR